MSEFDNSLNDLLKGTGVEGQQLIKNIQDTFGNVQKQSEQRLLNQAEIIKQAITERQQGILDNVGLDAQFQAIKVEIQEIADDAVVQGQLSLKQTADAVIEFCLNGLYNLLVKFVIK